MPTLRPGDVVVFDKLGSHKGAAIRRPIRAAGAVLIFLPAYSPDRNPTEQVFAKLKALLRKPTPETVDDTWKTIGRVLDDFAFKECARGCYVLSQGSDSMRADVPRSASQALSL